MPEYTAVIRTLGTAGEKYQQELDSLCSQTIPPKEILVYIAEGYPIPKETCGRERYIYVKKGMVAQRALPYDEVTTEYILFLDDDLYLPTDFVENMFKHLIDNNADVISPDIFPNDKRQLKAELFMTISGRMRARRGDRTWGYKVMRTGGYSYNKNPQSAIYLSMTNAGACFLMRKSDFLKAKFHDELWLDQMQYAIGDDQMMFYKMYLAGLKQLTYYNSGIKHLDAGNNMSREKEKKLISSDFFFKTVFWHRFIYLPEKSFVKRMWSRLCIGYAMYFGFGISLIKGRVDIFKVKKDAIRQGKEFISSEEYKRLPRITKQDL